MSPSGGWGGGIGSLRIDPGGFVNVTFVSVEILCRARACSLGPASGKTLRRDAPEGVTLTGMPVVEERGLRLVAPEGWKVVGNEGPLALPAIFSERPESHRGGWPPTLRA